MHEYFCISVFIILLFVITKNIMHILGSQNKGVIKIFNDLILYSR